MSQDFEGRLREALHQEAHRVHPAVDDPLADARRRARRQTRNQRAAAGLGVAAVLLVLGAALGPLLPSDMAVELRPDPAAQPPAQNQVDGQPEQGGANPPEQGRADPPEQGRANPPEQGRANPPEKGGQNPPRLGQECADPEDGYTIRYPDGWHTNTGEGQVSPCGYFHPEPFTLPDAPQEITGKAVSVFVDRVPFATAGDPGGPETREVLLEERVTVAGRPAVRYEAVSSGEAMFPEGTREYTYVIDVGDGRSMIVTTRDTTPDIAYEDAKPIMDRMVDSLRLDGS